MSVQYGLRVKATGELAKMSVSHHDGEFSSGIDASLDEYGNKTYLVGSVDDAVRTICGIVNEYSCNEDHPMLGSYTRADLEIVEVEMIVRPVSVEIEIPCRIDSADIYYAVDLRPAMVKSLLGETPPKECYVGIVFKSQTQRAEMTAAIGKDVMTDVYAKRRVVAVVDTPAVFKQPDGFMAIMTTMR